LSHCNTSDIGVNDEFAAGDLRGDETPSKL